MIYILELQPNKFYRIVGHENDLGVPNTNKCLGGEFIQGFLVQEYDPVSQHTFGPTFNVTKEKALKAQFRQLVKHTSYKEQMEDYIQQAEEQDGDAFWTYFESAEKAFADFKRWIRHVELQNIAEGVQEKTKEMDTD